MRHFLSKGRFIKGSERDIFVENVDILCSKSSILYLDSLEATGLCGNQNGMKKLT